MNTHGNKAQPSPRPDRSHERADPRAESGIGHPERDADQPGTPSDGQPSAGGKGAGGQETPPAGAQRGAAVGSQPQSGAPSSENAQPPTDEEKITTDMHAEEPLGWDELPTGDDDPRKKRHPKTASEGAAEDPDVKQTHRMD